MQHFNETRGQCKQNKDKLTVRISNQLMCFGSASTFYEVVL